MLNQSIIGIIPARYSSSRFPGKPLAVIHGKSMIQRVYEQASKAQCLSELVVATDDERICSHVVEFGGKALMTSPSHPSGTDRCQEVIQQLSAVHKAPAFDLVINIQGDEPFLDPSQVDQVISLFQVKKVMIATLVKQITDARDLDNPNVVKVIFNKNGKVLAFSRTAIPYQRGTPLTEWTGRHTYYKHIGLYGFRTPVLKQITALAPSPLETAESLEQLRWLENGFDIHAGITDKDTMAIDTPADLLKLSNIPG